ncbi:MAG: glycosyltransferase family 39 protein [Anaerolineales bacterium]|nr:glycosyltransferase family 39 protein [Anaerolineales bacterium]
MTTATLPIQPSFLKKNIFPGVTISILLVIVIMAFSFGMHMYNIESIGDANAYYTAAVKSMLQSWSNFFFVAAEPGGSVTVDKPPLGLWIEAVFAYFLGVSGFSVSLPNILAGVFGIPLLYAMVKKYMGELAGLVAAFVMAITPVFVATNRNNTMDGLLVFFLLLAAWAFIKATESENVSWLLLGAFIVGLGFNIKMMQAFLPLPAFYALYFFGSKTGWLRKIVNLGLATVLLLAVSLSWAVAVDLTPADSRPYIGSSEDNSVMGLIFGHNGVSRLGNNRVNPQQNGQAPANGQDGPGGQQGGGTPFSQETGTPGVLRFFTSPLSKQMSWLLPFALISVVLALFGSRIKLPIESGVHKALILWGGWLLTCIVFFSMVSGIFHSYYAIMLAPALGAMVGIGFAQLWSWSADKKWTGAVLVLSAVVTIGFQYFATTQYGESSWWMLGSGLLLGLGIILMVIQKRHLAYVTILAAMMVIPMYWTVMTVVANSDINLPTAYTGNNQQASQPPRQQSGAGSSMNEKMLAYLQTNTADVKYLLAVPSSQNGATFVIETGRPVLYMGGFGGQDDVVSAEDLSALVANGELRYVLYGGERGGKEDIASWLKASCSVVTEFSSTSSDAQPQGQNGQQRPDNQSLTLYMCK